MKKGLFVGASIAALIALSPPIYSAHASGPPQPCTQSFQGPGTCTSTFHDAVQVLQPAPSPDNGTNPCTGAPATITLTYNGVLHETANANGFWATGTETGSAVLVPTDPTQPTYTGHFTDWFGVEVNRQNFTTGGTFNVKATGSDGSVLQFHDNARMTVNADGTMTVNFDKPSCG